MEQLLCVCIFKWKIMAAATAKMKSLQLFEVLKRGRKECRLREHPCSLREM